MEPELETGLGVMAVEKMHHVVQHRLRRVSQRSKHLWREKQILSFHGERSGQERWCMK
jgi:hypothetical protein